MCTCEISSMATASPPVRLSCYKRHLSRFNFISRLRRGMQFLSGSTRLNWQGTITCAPVRFMIPHLVTRQYSRILDSWIEEIWPVPSVCGTHTMRLTKVSLIYRHTKNMRMMLWNSQSRLKHERPRRNGDKRPIWHPVTSVRECRHLAKLGCSL